MNDIYFFCNECKRTFPESDVMVNPNTIDLDVGYNGDYCCPFCSSTFIEVAEQCEVCGEQFEHDKCRFGICDGCAKKVRWTDVLAAEERLSETEKVEVPAFIAWYFGGFRLSDFAKMAMMKEDEHDLNAAAVDYLETNGVEVYAKAKREEVI